MQQAAAGGEAAQQRNPEQNQQQPRKFSKYDPSKHSHGRGYFYEPREGGRGGGGAERNDRAGVATTLDPSV